MLLLLACHNFKIIFPALEISFINVILQRCSVWGLLCFCSLSLYLECSNMLFIVEQCTKSSIAEISSLIVRWKFSLKRLIINIRIGPYEWLASWKFKSQLKWYDKIRTEHFLIERWAYHVTKGFSLLLSDFGKSLVKTPRCIPACRGNKFCPSH